MTHGASSRLLGFVGALRAGRKVDVTDAEGRRRTFRVGRDGNDCLSLLSRVGDGPWTPLDWSLGRLVDELVEAIDEFADTTPDASRNWAAEVTALEGGRCVVGGQAFVASEVDGSFRVLPEAGSGRWSAEALVLMRQGWGPPFS